MRVSLARVDGRLDGVIDRLDRQEAACETRADRHVDRDLYASERAADRTHVSDLDRRLNDLRTELAVARKEATDTRKWIITTGVAFVGIVVTAILAVML
jgi:hypothetical protein